MEYADECAQLACDPEAAEELAMFTEDGPPYPPTEFTSLARYLNGYLKDAGCTYTLPSMDSDFRDMFSTFYRCVEERGAKSEARHKELLASISTGWGITAAKIISDHASSTNKDDADSEDGDFEAADGLAQLAMLG